MRQVVHAFFDNSSARSSMPKMRFMSPEQHFIQTLLLVYVALVALTPFSGNMVHVSMQVIILMVGLLLPVLNTLLRLRGLRVILINTFVMFFVSVVCACAPFFVPTLLVEASNCVNATLLFDRVGNSEIVTKVNCSNITIQQLNETTDELQNVTVPNCTTYLTTSQWIDVMKVGADIVNEDFQEFQKAKFKLGSPLSKGSTYPEGPIIHVTLILFVYVFLLELPTRCTFPVAMVLFILIFSLYEHMPYTNLLHAFLWLIITFGRRVFLAVLATVRERRRQEADMRSNVKRSRIAVNRSGTPSGGAGKFANSGNYILPRVNSGLGSNPSFGSHQLFVYQPTLVSGRSPLTIPFLVIDDCCVVTEVSQPLAEVATMDESFIVNRNLCSLLEWLNAEMLADVMDVVESFAGGKVEHALALPPRRLLLRCCGVDGIDAEIVAKYSPRERAHSGPPPAATSGANGAHHQHGASGSILIANASTATQPPNVPAGSTPQHHLGGSQQQQQANTSAGRFAIILDCWRESEDQIVLQQPVAHSILQAIPAPICLLMADGTIVLWNGALQHITGLSSYDMIGQNAFTSLIGSPDQPMMKPRGFPFYAELSIGLEGKGLKTFSCTMIEWPECEGRTGGGPDAAQGSTPISGDAAIICYIDKGSKHSRTGGTGGKSGSSHLLSALGRLVNDFNDGKGSAATGANHAKRMTVFCEAVLSLVGQMAAIEAQENDTDEQMITYGSGMDGALSDGYLSETPGGQKLKRNGSSGILKTPGSGPVGAGTQHQQNSNHPTFLPTSPQPQVQNVAVPPLQPPAQQNTPNNRAQSAGSGVWARLISADEATFPSCVIATTMGTDFKAGRSANCTYKMLNTYVSSLQFSITRKPGAREPTVILTDHSANGTYVNVKMIGKGGSVTLNHGDLINFRLSNGRFFMGFIFQLVTGKQEHQREGVATTPSQQLAGDTPLSPSSRTKSMLAKQKAIKWKIGEEMLGKGGNAEVYLGMNLTNGKLMAVKRVSLPRDSKTLKQYVALQDEINLLSVAVHQNIVQYYGSSQSDSHLNILLEFVPGGSLRHLLDNFGPLSDTIIIRYLRQVLGGLGYLHDMEIVHSDVKCANILVTDKGQCKLTDFGTAKLMGAKSTSDKGDKADAASQQPKTFTVVGTLMWMAPELVRGETKPTAASDVWSLGCSILEMMSGEGPWNEYDFDSEEQIINLLKYTQEAPEIPPTSNAVIHAIAFECLKLNPKERPSCKHLLDVLNGQAGSGIQQQNQQARRLSVMESHVDPLGKSSASIGAFGVSATQAPIPTSGLAQSAAIGGSSRRSATPHQQYHNQAQGPGGGKLVDEIAKARYSISGGH